MAKYKTMQDKIIELTYEEWKKYPFNSTLMLIQDEEKTKPKEIVKEENKNGRRMVRKKHSL